MSTKLLPPDWPPYDSAVAQSWEPIEIPIRFHIIHDSSIPKDPGKVSSEKIDLQLAALNDAFAEGQIRFVSKEIEYSDRGDWFVLRSGSETESEAKHKLATDTKHSLNFYTANLEGTGVNGYAQSPWEFRRFPELDGVVVRYDSLPGNGAPVRYSLGGLGIHEVGHWFGLHHTFEGSGTTDFGDFVPDTPSQVVPTPCVDDEVKLEVRPKRNFMDRVCDGHKNEFTPHQFWRIRQVVLPRFKPWLLP